MTFDNVEREMRLELLDNLQRIVGRMAVDLASSMTGKPSPSLSFEAVRLLLEIGVENLDIRLGVGNDRKL